MHYKGALTNKSYAFEHRPWDLNYVNTIDIFDSLGSSISVFFYGSEIKRILPLKCDLVNEDWISNRTRYFFEGFHKWRVNVPLVRMKKIGMLYASWNQGFRFFILNLWLFSVNLKNSAISFILNNAIDYDLIITTKLLCNLMGYSLFKSSKITQVNEFYLFYINPNFFKDIKKKYVYLFFGINLRLESPILNVKLRKKMFDEIFIYCNLGSVFNDNLNMLSLGLNIKNLFLLFKGKLKFNLYIITLLKKYFNISLDFKVFENINFSILCLLGLNFFYQKDSLFIYKYLLDNIKYLNILYSIKCFNKKNTLLWEMICFKTKLKWYSLSYSVPININFLNLFSILYEDILLQGVNDFVNILLLDIIYIINGSYFFDKKNKNFVVFQGHHIDIKFLDVNIVFPNMIFFEKTTKFLNIEGFFFKTNKVIGSPDLVRNDWTILNAFYMYFIEFINIIFNFDLNMSKLNYLNSNRFFKNITLNKNINAKFSVNYFFKNISTFNNTATLKFNDKLSSAINVIINSGWINVCSRLSSKNLFTIFNKVIVTSPNTLKFHDKLNSIFSWFSLFSEIFGSSKIINQKNKW